MSPITIEARELKKDFNNGFRAVNQLNLMVPQGAVYGLLGRNGAGKTTTLRILMGLIRQSRGSAKILGREFLTAGSQQRCRVSYVPQFQQYHAWMTLEEHCIYLSHFYPFWDQDYAKKLSIKFDLPWDSYLENLSGGARRKASILMAFATRAEVLIMDEPAAGLDPVSRREFLDEIIDLLSDRPDTTVLISTPILSDLERIADHIGIMNEGRMLKDGPLEEFQTVLPYSSSGIFSGHFVRDFFLLNFFQAASI